MDEVIATKPLSSDRVVIVTGANCGLGYEIAKGVAIAGATVILACRSEEKAVKAIQQMKTDYAEKKQEAEHDGVDELSLEFMQLDLASFRSVQQFVDAFKRSGRKLHVLFCNAGMGMQPFALTEDGHERILQINYLAHFILIAKLLPVMRSSGRDCRVLMMTGSAHAYCTFDLNTIEYTGRPNGFSGYEYYKRSKLYQLMQMYCMSRRLAGSNITVNCVDPGVVRTDFEKKVSFREFRFFCMVCIVVILLLCRCIENMNAERGVRCSVSCVVDPGLQGVSGVMFDDFVRRAPSKQARVVEAQEALWQKTLDLVGRYLTPEEIDGMEGRLKLD